MAEEIVVKEPLWPDMMEAGKKFTEYLDSDGFDVRASLWFYVTEANEWRLLIASPLVDEMGPTKAYEKVRENLSKDPAAFSCLNLRNITVLSPEEQLIKLLAAAVRVTGMNGVRFTRNRINNAYIEDAYIYRTAR